LRLGGVIKDEVEGKGHHSDFDLDKIVIPVGITPQNLKTYTLYDVLGFSGEWGAAADTEVIKKAYHKAVLMYHPDKAQHKTADGKEDRSVFLKIQEAFNVLCNDQKRRAYDSQLPFDESIPTEERIQKQLAKGPAKFFKLYAPVFQRNARFATKKPVPDLGDMDTPLPQVYKFYQYWVKFESWRDFDGVGAEHKPDDAGSREEKRYMQKENDRISKKMKKREMERLIELVSLAEKYDPRIVADKEARANAKEAEKNAKENAIKLKADEEAAAKEWSDKLEAADKELKAANKVDREKLKKQQSKARNSLKKLLRHSATLGHGSGEYGILTVADVELLCANCAIEDLNELVEALGGDAAAKEGASALLNIAGFDAAHNKVVVMKEINDQILEDERITKEAAKREKEDKIAADRRGTNKKVVEDRVWDRETLSMLSKCVSRYPAGLPARWASITNYLNVQIKPTESFTQDEVLRAAYTLTHSPQDLRA
jgi:DnaJ family protein C protein 2